MNFQQQLATLPDIDHLSGLDILDAKGQIIHHIPAQAGKLGSLKVYYALSQRFPSLNSEAAEHGLTLFAEHVAAAQDHPGQHPNIDLLLRVIAEQSQYQLRPQAR